MDIRDLGEVAKIRERGQLTIPYKIRAFLTWLQEDSVVQIIPVNDKGIEIKPFVFKRQKALKKDQNKKRINALWREMRKIGRAGRQIKLAEFVINDREKH